MYGTCMAFPVVLDANVLFGFEVTDFLLSMAVRRMFRPHWSPQILEEVSRNIIAKGKAPSEAIERRIEAMNDALPDALQEVPDGLIEAMPVNEKDRHVLALAVFVGSDTIVTENLKDFPGDLCGEYGVHAIRSDDFAIAQVHLDRQGALSSIAAMAHRRTRHPRTPLEIMERLAVSLPGAMKELESAPPSEDLESS